MYVALYPYYTHITLPQSHESTLGPLPNFGDHMLKKARESDLKEHCSIVSPHVISIGKFYPVQKKKTPNSKTMVNNPGFPQKKGPFERVFIGGCD